MSQPARPAPEPRKPISLWWKLAGFVVLLVATVATIVYLGRPDDPRSSAQGTADLVARSLTDSDMSTFRSALCDDALVTAPDAFAHLGTTSVLDVTDENDNEAIVVLRSRGYRSAQLSVLLHNEDDSWCVFGVTQDS